MKELNYNITDIESMTEAEASAKVIETMEIKGFNVYFVDFQGYFGYSCLVFKNSHHIHYANDYELHHHYTMEKEGLEGLRKYYIESLNNKLFTDDEIGEPVTDYGVYEKKKYFLHNYYAMQVDHISMFGIFHNEEERQEYRKKTEKMIFDKVGFCYIDDRDFVIHHVKLLEQLEQAKDAMKDNFDYWKQAFLTEMYDHEYGINWQADWDVCSNFGNVEYHGDEENELDQYFNELKYTEAQRKAYFAARQEYFKKYVA